ncbi:hypothetical protein [Anaeroselena agilis]|uniref:DUF4352 domain-containing protein n=1 Tax=Anaeroselena agilis TaxID=3063788 RepID=A0ABU3P1G8_9FIRM|nr:hypothetical protein [Selenomonadales bacterium 4137-cl]
MDEKFVVAIIGALTGVAGLFLHFWRFFQERPTINLYQPTGEKGQAITCFPEDPEEMIYDSEGEVVHRPDISKYCFWLWIRITNTSERPLTFLEFTLLLPDVEPLTFDSDTYAPKYAEQVIQMHSDSYTVYEGCRVEPLIQPIFSLDPYKAIEGYIHFGPVDSDKLYNISQGKLKLITTRRTFTQSIRINPIFASSNR